MPKMDFQDQFIAINFGNISTTVLKRINDFKFLGKKKAAANVLLSMLAKVRALYCRANIFTKLLSLITERRHYKKMYVIRICCSLGKLSQKG